MVPTVSVIRGVLLYHITRNNALRLVPGLTYTLVNANYICSRKLNDKERFQAQIAKT